MMRYNLFKVRRCSRRDRRTGGALKGKIKFAERPRLGYGPNLILLPDKAKCPHYIKLRHVVSGSSLCGFANVNARAVISLCQPESFCMSSADPLDENETTNTGMFFGKYAHSIALHPKPYLWSSMAAKYGQYYCYASNVNVSIGHTGGGASAWRAAAFTKSDALDNIFSVGGAITSHVDGYDTELHQTTNWNNWDTLYPITDMIPRSIVKHTKDGNGPNTIFFHDNFIHKNFLDIGEFEDEDEYYTNPGTQPIEKLVEGPIYWLGKESPGGLIDNAHNLTMDITFFCIWRNPIQVPYDMISDDIENENWHTHA